MLFRSIRTHSSTLLTSKHILQGIRTLPVSERPSLLVALRSATPSFTAKEVRVLFGTLVNEKIHDLPCMEALVTQLPLRIPQCSLPTIAGMMESLAVLSRTYPNSAKTKRFITNSTALLGEMFVTIVDQTPAETPEVEAPCRAIRQALGKLPQDSFPEAAVNALEKVINIPETKVATLCE